MKQIQVEAFGPPSQVAKCVDGPDVGAPSAWEVIVDVSAFPLNVADLAILSGRYGTLPKLPSIVGMEAAGVVAEVGSSVKDLQAGDHVVILGNNNWAERRKLPVAAIHKVPKAADLLQMSMLKVNPTTAYLMLTNFAELSPGDWVLQTAPLSSVGGCVIQIAKSRGLRTINVVRRAESISAVQQLGGDIAIEDGPDLAQRLRGLIRHDSLMLALDAVAGAGVERLAECLSEGGKIINYGMLSNEPCMLGAEQTIFRGISLQGFWLSKALNKFSLVERKTLFDMLAELILSEKLKMAVDSCFGMHNIAAAIQRAEQGGRSGKVVVQCRT